MALVRNLVNVLKVSNDKFLSYVYFTTLRKKEREGGREGGRGTIRQKIKIRSLSSLELL